MRKFIAYLLSIATMVATLQTYVPAYEGQPLGKNVAFHRNVEVSKESAKNDYNKLDFLTDGNLETKYQSPLVKNNPDNAYEDYQTWSMDLGREYEIDKVVLYWEAAAAKEYDIYVSDDKKDWTMVATEKAGEKGRFKYDFTPVDARYVKIELKERASEGYGYCMYEWQVFTVGSAEEKAMTNLALDATATASSENGDNVAARAIDGDETTMWRSTPLFEDSTVTDEVKADENITLSWNSPQTFDTVKVVWNGGYMKGYKLQKSDNGEDWTDIAEVKDGKSAETRTIRLTEAVTTPYLRLQGVTYGAYCFEIKEIQVYDQTNIPAEYINLNYSNVKLNLDDESEKQIKLEYILGPSNTSQKDVVWTSSNEAVAEVKDGKSAETRTIRLTEAVTTPYLRLQGVTYGAYCFEIKEIQVYDQTNIPAEYINLNYSNVKLNLDDESEKQIKLEYILGPSNTSQKDVVWTSSNEAVAEVKDGVVTGKSVGTANITIASKDNPNVKNTCVVKVSSELGKSKVTAVRNGKDIRVNWSKVNHAESYVVTRYNKLTANDEVIYEGTATACEDKDLPSGKYVYIVKAIVDKNDASADLYSDSESEESEPVIIPEPVTGVEIINDYKNVSMFVGGSQQIKYGILPANATNTNVTFKSLDEKVATVDKDGVVTGVSKGNTKVIVTTEEGGFTAECTVNVDGIEIKGFERVGGRDITIGENQTRQLQVSITPENATDKKIQWTSTNEAVAAVDENGLVTSKSAGTAIITAKTNNGLQTEFFITVDSPVKSISLNYKNATLNPGKTLKLIATISPSNASNKKITWISANDTIATVSNGVVTAKKIGVTYISAISADGKVITTCTVTVTKPIVTKPAKVNLKSAKKKGTKVTLKWKKVTDAVGYVVYMKTNSGKYKLVKTIKKAKTVKCVLKLKKGKKYSFKVRAYKLDEGNKVYGTYSKIKKVKM